MRKSRNICAVMFGIKVRIDGRKFSGKLRSAIFGCALKRKIGVSEAVREMAIEYAQLRKIFAAEKNSGGVVSPGCGLLKVRKSDCD